MHYNQNLEANLESQAFTLDIEKANFFFIENNNNNNYFLVNYYY